MDKEQKSHFIKHAAIICFLMVLTGCAGTGNINESRFKPYIDSHGNEFFDFETDSSVLFKDTDEKAEGSRIDLLNKWIENSGYCPNGYKIVYRKSINLGGPKGYARIFYSGKCNP